MNIIDLAPTNIKQFRDEKMRAWIQRTDELLKTHPEFNIIQKNFINTMLSFMNQSNKKSIEDIEKTVGEMVAKRTVEEEALLKKYGYPTNYLERDYFCEICKDSGELCECINNERKKLFLQELQNSSALTLNSCFETINLDYYKEYKPHMQNVYDYCKHYADNFDLNARNLIMRGKPGLGKSHLSLSIAKKVIEKGNSVMFRSAPEMFAMLSREHFSDGTKEFGFFKKNIEIKILNSSDDLNDILNAVDLLIIDDFGVEVENKYYISALHMIVENRLNLRKPTIINTNLTEVQMTKRYGERITSRFYEYYTLNFFGEDIRKQKNAL